MKPTAKLSVYDKQIIYPVAQQISAKKIATFDPFLP